MKIALAFILLGLCACVGSAYHFGIHHYTILVKETKGYEVRKCDRSDCPALDTFYFRKNLK